MAKVRRYNPFDLDDMFRGLMLQPVPQIKMDVKENDGVYVVRADIPGVKKEEITVNIDGNMASISAQVKEEEKEKKKGERVVRSERYHGSVSRAITLDHDVDEKAALPSSLTVPDERNSRIRFFAVQFRSRVDRTTDKPWPG